MRNYFCDSLLVFFSVFFTAGVLAEEAPPKPTALEQFFPFILLGLLFYFLLIRPQQKKNKSHREFLSHLKRGDEVLTAGGIFGTIEGLTDQFVILEVDEKTRIRVMRSHITSSAKSLEKQDKTSTGR